MLVLADWCCLALPGGAWWYMAEQYVWFVLFGAAWRFLVVLGGAWWCFVVLGGAACQFVLLDAAWW